MKHLYFICFILLTVVTMAQTPFVEDVNGAQIGDTMAHFSALDNHNEIYHLSNDLAEQKVVVIFIRGQWCGYCNRFMSNLQDSLNLITDAGTKVVVVSPEKPEFLNQTIEKTKLEATILYDSGYIIMKQFDVLWSPKAKDLAKYKKYFGDKMKKSHSDNTQRLPVPATYIIGQNGVIKWRHFDKDYSNRPAVSAILENL